MAVARHEPHASAPAPVCRRTGRRPGACLAGRQASPWHLYVLECSDATLYVGIAKDVDLRLRTHNAGRGARYTRTRRPARLVYIEDCDDHGSALRREREVKRWSRPKKVAALGLGCAARLSAGPARQSA